VWVLVWALVREMEPDWEMEPELGQVSVLGPELGQVFVQARGKELIQTELGVGPGSIQEKGGEKKGLVLAHLHLHYQCLHYHSLDLLDQV
jgi:hypothetical protein